MGAKAQSGAALWLHFSHTSKNSYKLKYLSGANTLAYLTFKNKMVLDKVSGGNLVVEYLSHRPKAKGLRSSCHHWFWERENGGKKVFKSSVFVVAKLFLCHSCSEK